MGTKQIAAEVLLDLHQRTSALPKRSALRHTMLLQAANLYGVSLSTLYRQLKAVVQPKPIKRCDAGVPRAISALKMKQYCEVIAALKIRTRNKKGRHISTQNAIRLLEESGIETAKGFVQVPKGVLKKATVNRYLSRYALDLNHLLREAPAVRFQARHANECWQFDLSPSDLKHLKEPIWYDKEKGLPILMLYSVVDDRSGVCYQEYRCVYGEDAGNALRFLFNAMSPKPNDTIPFSGIPKMIYMDNGPIAKSLVFQRVMNYLGVEMKTHRPDSQDKRRKTARAKGKVERAFRTVKECHEVLYHLREPSDEQEANQMLLNYLIQYNDHQHRQAGHSRMEDWRKNLPSQGIQEMCSWERFCAFAREPEQRKVGIDARVCVDGSVYEIDANLAGERVVLWWGLFDDELFVEFDGKRYGGYLPVSGPIPLYRYQKFKKTESEKQSERIEKLAQSLKLPSAHHANSELLVSSFKQLNDELHEPLPSQPFQDPDPYLELRFPNKFAARAAIADHLGQPLSLLTETQRQAIEAILSETLDKKAVMAQLNAQHLAGKNTHAN